MCRAIICDNFAFCLDGWGRGLWSDEIDTIFKNDEGDKMSGLIKNIVMVLIMKIMKTRNAGIAGLVGASLLAGAGNLEGSVIKGVKIYDPASNSLSNVLVVGKPYICKVTLDTTASDVSGKSVKGVEWYIRLPLGANYSSLISFNGASMPTSNDFFSGFGGDGVLNFVDSTVDGNGLLTANSRYGKIQNPLVGPSNKIGFLEEIYFTPIALSSVSRSFSFSDFIMFATDGTSYSGASVPFDSYGFTIVQAPVPEPASGSALLALGSLGLLGRGAGRFFNRMKMAA